MRAIIKIAHVFAIITIVGITAFSGIENVHGFENVWKRGGRGDVLFVNPLDIIWINTSNTMFDAVIETGFRYETSALTIFG